jgi:hypothetical protein
VRPRAEGDSRSAANKVRQHETGTENVCHLRALFKSEKGQWIAFWARSLNKRSIIHQPK